VKVSTQQNVPVELALAGEPELDCTFVDPNGRELRVPGYGEPGELRVRYASCVLGGHRFRAPSGQEGVVEVRPYEGANPLLRRGPLRIGADGRRFAHSDGTPFLWLGDTWWLGLVDRLRWPDEFQRLAADRVAKGFSVVQIVSGLYPEMPPFDGRGGPVWPWREGFESLDEAWWDGADLKLAWLVRSGLVPCVVGAWGYHLLWSGVETMKRHWREVIARWAAYPVVWCLAGEATLPYYPDIFSEAGPAISARLREGWAEVARFVRETDPYGRLLTVHPSPGDGCFSSYDIFPNDASLFDFSMLQTGHWDRQSFPQTLAALQADLAREPRKPVLNGEVCYEGIMSSSWHDTQRFLVWTHLLSGAAGHTYGAQGLWAMNTGDFVGEAGSWADQTWEEAYRLPGSTHLGIAKQLLERFRWWEFEPHREWVEPHWHEGDRMLPYAAGITDHVRIVYFPSSAVLVNPPGERVSFALKEIRLRELGAGWRARYANPRTGELLPEQTVAPDADGVWTISGGFINSNPSMEDWVLVLERRP
jgi:hypothetical protein